MELLVFAADDFHPRSRYFDGPVMMGVQQAVGERSDVVPGFTSISCYQKSIGASPITPRRQEKRSANQRLGYSAMAHGVEAQWI